MATFFAIPIFVFVFFHLSLAQNTFYNVESYGARSDGATDCTAAFLSAWAAACASVQPSTVYVPLGRYLIGSVVSFLGQNCTNNGITFRVDGILVAPPDYNVVGGSGSWINFRRANGLSILGGTLDGQGTSLWGCKASGNKCPIGAASLAIHNSNNVRVVGLNSSNSQFFHIVIDGCNNTNLQGLAISAPADSPNTDGIHLESSSYVTIMDSQIGTGDDCISIGQGCSNFWIENINCGPGHGISIGSLGSNVQESGVHNVTVKNVKFIGTQNGARIKTWAKPSNDFVYGIKFQNATMVNVLNPIIIDQNYCPNGGTCSSQPSGVRISNVAYQDVHGTSATEVAVNFDCSKYYPCSNITLENVNLTLQDQLPATASCVNACGTSSGIVNPRSCLQ